MSKKNNSNASNNIIDTSKLEEYINSQFKNKNSKKVKSNEFKTSKYDETRAIWNTNNRIVNLFADSVKNDNKLKNNYGKIFLFILGLQLVAMYLIFALVGAGCLKYNNTTLNIFISGGLIETFALVKVIVVNLFNDNLVNSLNIILENNNKTLNNKKFMGFDRKKIDNINNEINQLIENKEDAN